MNQKLKQSNGITLIALVITIIVLLILAGVTISMVLGDDGIIKQAGDAKENQERETELERVKNAVASALIDGKGKLDLTKADEEKNEKTKGLEKALEEEFKNESEAKSPKYKSEGKIELSSGEIYNITTSGNVEKAITFSKISDGNLAIGSEVIASNGEHFYVIGGDDVVGEMPENSQDIILLAKYNLKKVGNEITLKQDTTAYTNKCVFSNINYWDSEEKLSYPMPNDKYPDLNNETEYPIESANSIITTAKEYGLLFKADGRLMTVEEVVAFGGDEDSQMSEKCPDFINFEDFWLGSAYNSHDVWYVYGELQCLTSGDDYDNDYRVGVRPVIKVSKFLIK